MLTTTHHFFLLKEKGNQEFLLLTTTRHFFLSEKIQKNYLYHTRRQGGGRGAEKNSENYLMDMLQVVVHIQIKKQHNVLPTNPCIRIIFKHHCLSNHQNHKIIMCFLVGVGQKSLLINWWTGVTLFNSAGGRPFLIYSI